MTLVTRASTTMPRLRFSQLASIAAALAAEDLDAFIGVESFDDDLDGRARPRGAPCPRTARPARRPRSCRPGQRRWTCPGRRSPCRSAGPACPPGRADRADWARARIAAGAARTVEAPGVEVLERGFELGLEVGVPLALEGDLGRARLAGGPPGRFGELGIDLIVRVRASGPGSGPRERGCRCGVLGRILVRFGHGVASQRSRQGDLGAGSGSALACSGFPQPSVSRGNGQAAPWRRADAMAAFDGCGGSIAGLVLFSSSRSSFSRRRRRSDGQESESPRSRARRAWAPQKTAETDKVEERLRECRSSPSRTPIVSIRPRSESESLIRGSRASGAGA